MGMFLYFLLLLLCVLNTVLIQAQDDQSGFISIDCGRPDHLNYSDKITTINYTSDANFRNTGVSKRLLGNSEKLSQQLEYLRSFPNGVRNCYRINVISGTKYLIRAFFYYGNYDNLNQPPQFDLHFGANVWGTVKLTDLSSIITSEIIYTPSLDYIQPCLVNIGKGTPFISAIELRPLSNTAYVIDSTNSVLSSVYRYDSGSITNSGYRYKDDVYDRIWEPFKFNNFNNLNSSFSLDSLVQNGYIYIPPIVMSTAVTPVNPESSIDIIWKSHNKYDQYYLYMHFSEVEKLAENEAREFNIKVNGKFWHGPVRPVYQEVTTVSSPSALTGAKRYEISLSKTETSTLPPILNAFEIYKVKDFSQSEGSLSNSLDPNLCEPASCNQKKGDQKKKKNNITIHVASVAVILVPLVLASAAAIIFFLHKRKLQAANNHVQSNTPNDSQLESKLRQNESQLESKQRQYTYDEVDEITNNLNRILGRGGFGTVYYGLIDDIEVAVKMLSKSSVQGYQQFLAEVKLLMRVHHRNLTSLIGYCNEGNNIGLIYEYMANGNLDELLSGKNNKAKFLTWEDRLGIAVDAAQGLEYLHNGCYLDPEYMTSNRLTEKSDVYSFGVVLLEIVTSQAAIIKSPDKTHISQWVRSMLYNGDIENIVDSRLQQNFDTNSAWKAVEIGMACVSLNSSNRPNMNEVVHELKECLAAELARKRDGRCKAKKGGSIELIPLTLTIELSPQAR
ncbi:putative LRR receptor serine/threonine-protein kinase [Trifolium repens]|nr:putative LRR receptor serine/threonine-protein kinase [Trifolium repens]